jgi:hypothetical protein
VIVPEKHDEWNEEKKINDEVGTAKRLRAIIGIRNRQWHVVEILGIEDPKKKEQVPLDADVEFVVKGGNGLEDGDKVKKEVDED